MPFSVDAAFVGMHNGYYILIVIDQTKLYNASETLIHVFPFVLITHTPYSVMNFFFLN